MNCETCKERQKQTEPVPYIVHESAMARAERANRRLWIALILVIVLLVGSNIAWIVYENQFADIVEETYSSEADGGGIAIVNRDGSVNYGESDLHTQENANP